MAGLSGTLDVAALPDTTSHRTHAPGDGQEDALRRPAADMYVNGLPLEDSEALLDAPKADAEGIDTRTWQGPAR